MNDGLSTPTLAPVLDYRRDGPRRWRRVLRFAVVALLLVALAMAGLFAVRSLSLYLARREGYAKVAAWYEQARTCVIPAGTLVYSDVVSDLIDSDHYVERPDHSTFATVKWPWPLRSVGSTTGGVPSLRSNSVIYVHEHSARVTTSGSRPMVVCVSYYGSDSNSETRPEFLVQSVDLATPMPRFQIASISAGTQVQDSQSRSLHNLRIFAGAPDPADPTKFSLPFTCDGGSGRFAFQTDVDVTDGGKLAPDVTIVWDATTQPASQPATRPGVADAAAR